MGRTGPLSRHHGGATEGSAANHKQNGETESNKRTTGKKVRYNQENRSMDENDSEELLDDVERGDQKIDGSQLEGSLTEGLTSDFIAES